MARSSFSACLLNALRAQVSLVLMRYSSLETETRGVGSRGASSGGSCCDGSDMAVVGDHAPAHRYALVACEERMDAVRECWRDIDGLG